jgi:hypothetical protein
MPPLRGFEHLVEHVRTYDPVAALVPRLPPATLLLPLRGNASQRLHSTVNRNRLNGEAETSVCGPARKALSNWALVSGSL